MQRLTAGTEEAGRRTELPKAAAAAAAQCRRLLDGRRMGELERGKNPRRGEDSWSLEARRRQAAAVVTDGGGVVAALVGFGERAGLRREVS